MPLRHCKSCHHEWEGQYTECDWCGAKSYVIEKETTFERWAKMFIRRESGPRNLDSVNPRQ